MTISDLARASAQELADTFAAPPRFVRCHNNGTVKIDIGIGEDAPGPGLGSVGTVTLADHDLGFGDTRLQIIALFRKAAEGFSGLIGGSALAVVELGWPLRWGACHPDLLTVYGLSETLPHLYFVPPFSWRGGPGALSVGEQKVEWLQAIPIAEAERAYAEANGAATLEEKLVAGNVDITDLTRTSVV
ncbi:MAG: suppressor of fused domain protein [Sphingomonas sp.]